MLYTDSIFLLLFVAIVVTGKLLQPWPVIREWFLIGCSLLVIASWGYFDLGLFLAVLFVNFWGALMIDRGVAAHRSKAILIAFIVLDISTLALFKYSNFIGQNIGVLTGIKVPSFPLGIPLAISFYIFHLISYLVDLHKRRVRLATAREYLFYLAFFPHVIAGPIVRAWQLVPQIGKIRRVRIDFAMGVHFMVTGFFLKMVMANNIGTAIDPLWTDTAHFAPSTLDHWAVAFLYYCQIYGDFAGYSLMALGMARLLGYRLPVNFRSPMRAGSIQEFWTRWHITLSRWLRDYLYIPMGGNRCSTYRACQNVMLTMLLGGLWHGAGWGFIFWGAMQGIGIITERFVGITRPGHAWPARLAWFFIAQLWIIGAWVFFRAPDLHTALYFFWQMIPLAESHNFFLHRTVLFALLCATPVVGHNFVPLLLKAVGRKRLGLVLGASTGVMLLANIITFSPAMVFIYFRF